MSLKLSESEKNRIRNLHKKVLVEQPNPNAGNYPFFNWAPTNFSVKYFLNEVNNFSTYNMFHNFSIIVCYIFFFNGTRKICH